MLPTWAPHLPHVPARYGDRIRLHLAFAPTSASVTTWTARRPFRLLTKAVIAPAMTAQWVVPRQWRTTRRSRAIVVFSAAGAEGTASYGVVMTFGCK